MAYTFKKFVLEKPTLAFRFLMDTFNISMGEAQKMIDKRRVFVEDEQLLKKNCKSLAVTKKQLTKINDLRAAAKLAAI